MRDRVTVWMAVVGVLAVVAGTVFAVLALRPDDPPSGGHGLESSRFVSRAGGFSLRVPTGMKAARTGRTARFTSLDKRLVVSVGPAGAGPVKAASAGLLRQFRATYPRVEVLGRRAEKVDGRRALTTYGRVRNADKVALRFVVVVVAAKPRTFAMTAFTSSGDAGRVVPMVNKLAGTFHVLPDKPRRR